MRQTAIPVKRPRVVAGAQVAKRVGRGSTVASLSRILGVVVAGAAVIAGSGGSPAAARPLSFEQVSLSPSGAPFSGDDQHSFAPSVSADGAVVAFTHGVIAGVPEAALYVRDRRAGRTELASVFP